MTKIVRFKGVDCANCAAKLEKKINKMKGVQATISFASGKLMLELDNEALFGEVMALCKKVEPEFEYQE